MERTLPATWHVEWPSRWPLNMAGAVVIAGVWVYLNLVPFWGDAHGYWYSMQPGVEWYGRQWNVQPDAFVYSPPAALAFTAIAWMPWPIFYGLWTALLLGLAAWMLTPALAALLLIPELPLRAEVMNGGISLLIAASVVVALRGRAAAWALPILTKVTPGIGLLWHAARGEWRAVRQAVIAIGVLVAISLMLVPHAWTDWIALLLPGGPTLAGSWIEIPLPLRAVAMVPVMVYAARKDAAWLVPVAVWVVTPNWAVWQSTTILVASVALWRRRSIPKDRQEHLRRRGEGVVQRAVALVR